MNDLEKWIEENEKINFWMLSQGYEENEVKEYVQKTDDCDWID